MSTNNKAAANDEATPHAEIDSVDLDFGSRPVFSNLSCRFPRGQITVLMGGSGRDHLDGGDGHNELDHRGTDNPEDVAEEIVNELLHALDQKVWASNTWVKPFVLELARAQDELNPNAAIQVVLSGTKH